MTVESSGQMPLLLTLEVGVPLRAHEIKSRGGPSDFDLQRCREFATTLGSKGDSILYRSKNKGETADLTAQLIDALAVLSFFPGGVTFLGQHWEA
jgi:hypothetical protein